MGVLPWPMSDDPLPAPDKKSATEILAALVAQRKAGGGSPGARGGGQRDSERIAAARSAAKSKPALRK